jgi:hypothetical protein
MTKKIDADTVAREDMPSYKKGRPFVDEGPRGGLGSIYSSPYQSGKDSEYNSRNDAKRKKYIEDNRQANKKSNSLVDAVDAVNTKAKALKVSTSAEPVAPVSKPAAEATVAVKKSEPKSMAAPVKKSSPREETSGSRASRQAAYDAFKADEVDYNKGLANDRMGVTADDTAELASLTDEDFKKGGMTKRPPARPTKKVPPRKFASGGTTRSSTSHRGDGCATKGHTKGRVR